MNNSGTIDMSVSRRRYYSKECGLTVCPECHSPLIEKTCVILLKIKSDVDEGDFMTNISGSHFCHNCPVIIFDTERVEQAAKIGIESNESLRYLIAGVVDLDSIPEEKKHLEIGIDENPVPLVRFLPDLNTAASIAGKKRGRNESCYCGSGKKYKKCCGG